MEFIGRTKELSDLKQEYNNKHSFDVIYGRRRIGKTALIQEFIKGIAKHDGFQSKSS